MRYGDADAMRMALEQRLRNEAAATGVALLRLRKRVAFERFLARLAASPAEWVLKGAFALELRLGLQTRMTKDIDLARDEDEAAVTRDLTAAAALDLQDFFAFQVRRTPARPGRSARRSRRAARSGVPAMQARQPPRLALQRLAARSPDVLDLDGDIRPPTTTLATRRGCRRAPSQARTPARAKARSHCTNIVVALGTLEQHVEWRTALSETAKLESADPAPARHSGHARTARSASTCARSAAASRSHFSCRPTSLVRTKADSPYVSRFSANALSSRLVFNVRSSSVRF